MKIASVQVYRLFNEFDYDIDLCGGLTFVHSPNGMGKSTLMRMIYAALRGDVAYLRQTPFERLDICFEDGSALIVENYPGNLIVQMSKSEIEVPLTPEEMSQIVESVYIPPDRMLVRRKDGHMAPVLAVFAQELHETIRYAKEHRELEPSPREGVSDMPDGDLEFWCKDLKAKLDFIKDAGFEPDIPAGKKFPPSRYEIIKDRRGYEELACSVADYVDRNYVLAESIIIYKDVVNEIFLNKEITVSDTGRIGVTMNNGMSLQVQNLSSGEKQILVMFYALLFHAPQGSVVILDEPEISLHVSWQQMLGGYFRDICRVRDVQMIVATHSPQVIHDGWDSARELRPSNARVPDLRRHMQLDVHAEDRLQGRVPRGGGRNRRPHVRQVHRQGRRPRRGGAL